MYSYHFGLREWLIGCTMLMLLLPIVWRRKRNIWYLLFFSCFWLYLLLLVSITLFPIPIGGERWTPAGLQPWQYTLQQINWIPFNYHIEFDGALTNIVYEVLQNILMTIPFGFGINFLTRVKLRNLFWMTALAGFSIETAQLVISLLFGPYHTIDITDVILNGLGVVLGHALFCLFVWLHQRRLGTFFDEIVRQ